MPELTSPSEPRRMRILLLIRSLAIGGAEGQLGLLARGLWHAGHSVVVAVLYPGGPFEAELRQAGVPIVSLEKRGRYELAGITARLARVVRRERIDVIYTALTAANLLGAAVRLLVPRIRVVWTLRAGHMDLQRYDRWMRLTSAVEPWLSRFSDRIIVNSKAGLTHAVASGFPRDKMTVVVNGVDTGRFRPDPEGRDLVRSEWKVSPHEPLVGLVGRIDPMKDHRTFLAAAALLKERTPNIRFVCVGDGPEPYVRELRDLAKSLGIEARVLWAGPRSDMTAVYNALDALALCSTGEGLPNVVAEAMACGTPCAVTDVGDAAWVVGETGIVVPPSAPAALADGIAALLERPRTPAWREELRRRVVENLGVERLIEETAAILRQVVSERS